MPQTVVTGYPHSFLADQIVTFILSLALANHNRHLYNPHNFEAGAADLYAAQFNNVLSIIP